MCWLKRYYCIQCGGYVTGLKHHCDDGHQYYPNFCSEFKRIPLKVDPQYCEACKERAREAAKAAEREAKAAAKEAKAAEREVKGLTRSDSSLSRMSRSLTRTASGVGNFFKKAVGD